MSEEQDHTLLDTLFNANVRSSTREQVLAATLKALDVKVDDFIAALKQEAQNPENVGDDLRARDRDGGQENIKQQELKWMKGEALS